MSESSFWSRVVAQYPLFADTLVPGPDAKPITLEDLSTPEFLLSAIAEGQRIFSIEQPKFAGQLWFYTFCNAMVAPSVYAMVEFGKVPSLDLSKGSLHAVDDFWFGFSTDEFLDAQDYRLAGEQYGASVAPIIKTLCEVTDLRPAPLWAVAGDCMAIAAMQAGDEAFEPELAQEVAVALAEGLSTAASVPTPRFTAEGKLRRASCCMIYHSPKADMCTSCPHLS